MAISGIASPVAGTIITTAFVDLNYREPLLYAIGLLGGFGGEPDTADKMLISSGAESANWVARASAVLDSIANNTLDGDDKLIVGSVTGNAAGSAIPADSIHANRLTASLTSGEFARITGSGAVVAMANIIGTIPPTKLDATPSAYNAGSPFVISTSNTTAATTNVGIAGVYEIHVTFVIKMVANSAVNDANVAFTADLYKTSGIFGPQLRKYLPPVASAPGEGYDSQEYHMHMTIQQAMNASEPIAMIVVKSGGTGGTRCEQAIISAVRIGP